MSDYQFSKRMRLLTRRDFDRVFAARASASDPTMVVYGAHNELGYPRLGLAVSRKVGSAVTRNRWKRVLREAFRIAQRDLPPLDLVCIPRVGAQPVMHSLSRSLTRLARRLARQLDHTTRRDGQPLAAPSPDHAAPPNESRRDGGSEETHRRNNPQGQGASPSWPAGRQDNP